MQLNIQEILDSCIGKYLILTKVKYQWKYWESERKNAKSATQKFSNYHTSNVDVDQWDEYTNKYLISKDDARTKYSFIEKNIEKYKILSIDTFRNEDDEESDPILEFQLEGFKSKYFFIRLDQTFEIE